MKFYGNVRRIAKEKKTSVHAMEKDLGFPRGSVCKWDKHPPSVTKVKAVAEHLGVTVDELLHEEDDDG